MIFSNFIFGMLLMTVSTITDSDQKVTGRLVEKVDSKFDCGVIKAGVVNKFIVVENGKDTKDTIKVVCICPEGYGQDFFKAGNVYNLTVSSNLEILKECYVMDKYPSQKIKLFVLQRIENY